MTAEPAPVFSCDSENDQTQVADVKKKKRRSKKKAIFNIPEQDNSCFRLLGNWKANSASLQSYPPTAPVRHSPVGEIQEYRNSSRKSSAEAKEKELRVFDRAIEDIEKNYGHILFSPEFFVSAKPREA